MFERIRVDPRSVETTFRNFKTEVYKIMGEVQKFKGSAPDLVINLKNLFEPKKSLAAMIDLALQTTSRSDDRDVDETILDFSEEIKDQVDTIRGFLPPNTLEVFFTRLVSIYRAIYSYDENSEQQTSIITSALSDLGTIASDLDANFGGTHFGDYVAEIRLLVGPSKLNLLINEAQPKKSEVFDANPVRKKIDDFIKNHATYFVLNGRELVSKADLNSLITILEVIELATNDVTNSLSPEQKSLNDSQKKHLRSVLDKIRTALVLAKKSPNSVSKLKILRAIVLNIQYDSYAVLGFDTSLLRPDPEGVPNPIFGEWQMYEGALDSTLDKIQIYAERVIEGDQLSEADVNALKELRVRILKIKNGHRDSIVNSGIDTSNRKLPEVANFLALQQEFAERIDWVDRVMGRSKASSTGSGSVELVLPNQKTESAWANAYKEWIGEQIHTGGNAAYDKIRSQIALITHEEETHAKREPLSKEEFGYRIAGLRLYLKEYIKIETSTDETLRSYYLLLENRMRLADSVGIYGASDKMAGDPFGAFGTFPLFASWDIWYWNGTKRTTHDYERYEFATQVRFVENKYREYFTEQYDFVNKPSQHVVGGVYTQGFFNFARNAWVTGAGEYNVKIQERVKEELRTNFPSLSKQLVEEIARVAFSNFVLTGGRGDLFPTYYAVGISPPELSELGKILDIHPLAKSLNLGTKTVTEIPEVVLGLNISPKWLLKMATQIGVYATFKSTPNLFSKITNFNKDRLWGFNTAPDLADTKDFSHFIDTLSDAEADQILVIIRDSSIEVGNTFTRFRNLLRSIRLSVAKRDFLEVYYPEREFELLDVEGKLDHHGFLLPPLMITPHQMHLGPTESNRRSPFGYFAAKDIRFNDVYAPIHEAVVKFIHWVESPPPAEIKSGSANLVPAIKAIVKDFQNGLSMTSSLKKIEDFGFWPKFVEMYEHRLNILFSAFTAAGFNVYEKPISTLTEYFKEVLGLEISVGPENLINALRYLIENSGQTMGVTGEMFWLSIDEDLSASHALSPRMYHAFDGKSYNMKNYLLLLLQKQNKRTLPAASSRKLEDALYHQPGPQANSWRIRYDQIRSEYQVDEETVQHYRHSGHGAKKAKGDQSEEIKEKEALGKK